MMARICLASPKGGMLQSRPVPLYEVLAAARQGSRIKAKRRIWCGSTSLERVIG
jgi:hypothetical protein